MPTRPTLRACPGRATACALLLGALLLAAGGGAASAADSCAPRPGLPRVPALERHLSTAQICQLRFLQHLGWRFQHTRSVTQITLQPGTPLVRETLEESIAAGDLRVLLPAAVTAADASAFAGRLPALIDSLASRAAYKFRVAAATRRATSHLARMTRKGRHDFPELFGLVHSPWFRMSLPCPQWVQRDRLFVACGSPARAMQSIYDRGACIECYVGQLLALYLIQYELFGAAWFDEAFKAEELVVGRPGDWQQQTLGRLSREWETYRYRALLVPEADKELDPGVALARYGPHAFAGLSGVVGSMDPDVFCFDNLVIVSVSQRAAQALAEGGGLQLFIRQTRRIWEEEQRSDGLFISSDVRNEADRIIEGIYASPPFKEIQVYCHPYGIVPLGYVLHRKMMMGGGPCTYASTSTAWRTRCTSAIARPSSVAACARWGGRLPRAEGRRGCQARHPPKTAWLAWRQKQSTGSNPALPSHWSCASRRSGTSPPSTSR